MAGLLRRRWMIVATLVLLAVSAWTFDWLREARNERVALEYLNEAGALAALRWDDAPLEGAPEEPPARSRLRQWLGDALAANVADLELQLPPETTLDLACLRSFPQLVRLNVQMRHHAPAGHAIGAGLFEHLPRLASLKSLSIVANEAAIDDRCLAYLAECRKLQAMRLYVSSVQLSHRGLAHLQRLRELQVLDVRLGLPYDDWLEQIARIGSLRQLRLADNLLRDEHLAPLRNCRQLAALDLSANNITDAGLAHLAECRELQELDLTDTNVSGASLTAIAALPKLRRVVLDGTLVSGEEIAQLRQRKPALNVIYSTQP